MRPQFCPLTGASVDASRAGSRVDFTSTCCRVTPTRGSLVQSKRYLSHSWPLSLLLGQAYQSFAILSTVFAFFYTAPEPVSLRCIVNSRRSSRSRCRCLGSCWGGRLGSGGSQCGAGRYVPRTLAPRGQGTHALVGERLAAVGEGPTSKRGWLAPRSISRWHHFAAIGRYATLARETGMATRRG